jgi:general secretion pathway protein M
MTLSLRPVFRRSIALFMLAITIFILWSLILAPAIASFSDRGGEIGEARYLLGKYQHLAAKKGAAEESRDRANAARASRGEFMREETPALASANLQTRLRAMVNANKVVMSAARTLPATEQQGLQRVALRVTVTGDLEAIKKTIHKIESNVPYLIIDNLDLKPSRVQGAPELINMDASFDVIGFLDTSFEAET